ncbi:uncharacterized protein LOC119606371 [Lucilia sericata]|uniref:uncharacterized protein LOC119606371 n=1 Tax=Lucilia sericata TaxID=13632 RepID=UPI0018A8614F|nr:uncharacterized protein LOC119606371 [Lucilia sericata]
MPVSRSPEQAGAEALETTEQPLCIICNENLGSENKTVTTCNHCFHSPCLRRWLETSPTCPVCRQPCNNLDGNSQDFQPTRLAPSNTRIEEEQFLVIVRTQDYITNSNNNKESMFQNINIGNNNRNNNNTNSPNLADNRSQIPNLDNRRTNPSSMMNTGPNPTPDWPQDNPFRADQSFRPAQSHRRSGHIPLPVNVDNSPLTSHQISNLINNWRVKYSGLNNDISIDEFIYRVNTLTSIHLNGNFDLLVEHVHSLFEGKALKWFWRFHRQTDTTPVWFDLCDALRREFKDTNTDYDIKDDMRRRKQKNSESFDSFLDTMMNLSDKLRIPFSESEFVEIIIRNLRTELRHELLHLNINDISTLRKEVRKHEKFFEDLSSHSSSRPRYSRPNVSEILQSSEVNELEQEELSEELRSSMRIRNFWIRRKQLKKFVVSSIVNNGTDTRPFVNLCILNKTFLSLLDSGANKSCIAGSLCQEI